MRKLKHALEDIDDNSAPGDHHGLGSTGYAAAALSPSGRAGTIHGGEEHVRISGNMLVVDRRRARPNENSLDRIVPALQKAMLVDTTFALREDERRRWAPGAI